VIFCLGAADPPGEHVFCEEELMSYWEEETIDEEVGGERLEEKKGGIEQEEVPFVGDIIEADPGEIEAGEEPLNFSDEEESMSYWEEETIDEEIGGGERLEEKKGDEAGKEPPSFDIPESVSFVGPIEMKDRKPPQQFEWELPTSTLGLPAQLGLHLKRFAYERVGTKRKNDEIGEKTASTREKVRLYSTDQ